MKWEPSDSGRRREAGFALLIVLWSLALLALIGVRLAATGRSQVQLAGNLQAAARAEAAADAALHEALFRLLDASPSRWDPVQQPLRRIAVPGGVAEVMVESLGGLLNPNIASPDQWQELLRRLGVETQQAVALTAALLDWRQPATAVTPDAAKAAAYRRAGRDYAPPGEPFHGIDELGLVLGMSPELLERLRPLLSTDNPGEPDPALAPPLLAEALAASAGAGMVFQAPPVAPAQVVRITATARLAGPAETRFTRQAVVRLGSGPRGRPWRVLRWDQGVAE